MTRIEINAPVCRAPDQQWVYPEGGDRTHVVRCRRPEHEHPTTPIDPAGPPVTPLRTGLPAPSSHRPRFLVGAQGVTSAVVDKNIPTGNFVGVEGTVQIPLRSDFHLEFRAGWARRSDSDSSYGPVVQAGDETQRQYVTIGATQRLDLGVGFSVPLGDVVELGAQVGGAFLSRGGQDGTEITVMDSRGTTYSGAYTDEDHSLTGSLLTVGGFGRFHLIQSEPVGLALTLGVNASPVSGGDLDGSARIEGRSALQLTF